MDYQAIFGASPDGILVVDADGRIVDANPMAVKLFGYSRERLIELGVDALVPDGARRGHAARRGKYAHQPTTRPMGIGMELSARRADGTEFPVEISLSPYRHQTGATMVIATVRDITQRKQLQNLGVASLRAAETERKRVARELHDDTAQRLAALLIRLRVIERDAPAGATPLLEAFREELAACAEGVRRIARGLRPPELEDAGLIAALRAHTRALRDGTGMVVELDADAVDEVLDPDRRLVLYRIVQEALANVSKHSGATTARVEVRRREHEVVVSVSDDGRGFREGQQSTLGGGLGLVGMQERAGGLGGRVQVQSSEGKGTKVTVALPVASHESHGKGS